MGAGGDDLLTTKEALALLGVSRTTLYQIIREGALAPVPGNPSLRVQKRRYFRRADVERLLREGRRPPSAPARDAD